MENYTSNSNKSKEAAAQPQEPEKRVQKPVVSGKVSTKKKSVGRRFLDTFISEDAKSIKDYLLGDVLIPALKETIVDSIVNSVNMMFYGTTNRRTGGGANRLGGSPQFSYNKCYTSGNKPQQRVGHQSSMSFDDIIFDSRGDAEECLNTIIDIVSDYGAASVADLYSAADLAYPYTYNRYGWTDLYGARVRRNGSGFSIDLPKPIDLD